MSKYTLVIEFEDGTEPPVCSGMNILGGKLAAVAFTDALSDKLFSVFDALPPANQPVLLFDANGEGWLIGWRSAWHTAGQVETGEWDWSFQIGDLQPAEVDITHWAPIPDEPENEA